MDRLSHQRRAYKRFIREQAQPLEPVDPGGRYPAPYTRLELLLAGIGFGMVLVGTAIYIFTPVIVP